MSVGGAGEAALVVLSDGDVDEAWGWVSGGGEAAATHSCESEHGRWATLTDAVPVGSHARSATGTASWCAVGDVVVCVAQPTVGWACANVQRAGNRDTLIQLERVEPGWFDPICCDAGLGRESESPRGQTADRQTRTRRGRTSQGHTQRKDSEIAVSATHANREGEFDVVF